MIEKPAKRKASPAQRAALRKGRATMKANAKARRQAKAAAVREIKSTQGETGDAPIPPYGSVREKIAARTADHLFSDALIGDGELPSWLKD